MCPPLSVKRPLKIPSVANSQQNDRCKLLLALAECTTLVLLTQANKTWLEQTLPDLVAGWNLLAQSFTAEDSIGIQI